MRSRDLLAVCGLALAPLSGVAHAQQAPTIRTDVDTTVVTLGDRIGLTVEVEHDASSRVLWPDSLDLSPFEVADAQLQPLVRSNGRVRSAVRYQLVAFELGDLEVPRFDVTVVAADSSVTELETDAFGITVTSVGQDEGGNIREIKGPLAIPRSVIVVLGWLLPMILLAALLYWLYRRRRRKQEGAETVAPIIPARPPHEVAYEALDGLAASPLLERGDVKQFHVEVAEILRSYIEGQLRVDAMEMTTGEVMASLAQVRLEPRGSGPEPSATPDSRVLGGIDAEALQDDVLERFRRFLERSDLVKFAKLRPDADASRALIDEARGLVDETRDRVLAREVEEAEETDEDETIDGGRTGDETLDGGGTGDGSLDDRGPVEKPLDDRGPVEKPLDDGEPADKAVNATIDETSVQAVEPT